MSKSKKKQRNKRRVSEQQYAREQFRNLKTALAMGERLGSESGAYQRVLSLTDETAIRECESRLSKLEKQVFHTWLLYSVPRLTALEELSETFLERLMSSDADTFRAIMVTSVLGAIHELWSSDGKSGLPKMEDAEHVGARFAASVRSEFRNFQVGTYNEQIRSMPYDNPMIMRIGCMVDWDRVLNGNNLAGWSKNCLGIIEGFASEEQLATLKRRRDEIFLELAEHVASLIKETMMRNAEELRKCGLSCSYQTDFPCASPELFSLDELASPFTRQVTGAGLSPAARKTCATARYEELEFNDVVLCECTLARLASGLEFEDISVSLTGKFTLVEILYAALAAMADCRTIASTPAVLHAIFAALAYSGFPSNVADYGYTERDLAKKIELNTVELTVLSEKQLASFVQVAPDERGEIVQLEAPVARSINLAQFIFNNTGMVAPPTLTIHLRETRILESLGLTRTEAIALSGYMEGLRNTRKMINSMAENNETAEWFAETSGADGDMTEEDQREQIRQEIEAELKSEINAVKELRANTETKQRKLMREHRTAVYRAEKAEHRIEEMEAETKKLQKEVSALVSEREELQRTLLAVTEQEKEPETEEPLKARFPMDIGKNMNFVVFGGPQNWAAEQHRRFPNISFYDVDTMPNEKVVENADILMLNTFVMQHRYFWMIQSAARRASVPMRYFTNRGINRGSEQIIEVYRSYMDERKP